MAAGVLGGMKMLSPSLGPGTALGERGEAPWVGPAAFSLFRLYILALMKTAAFAAPGLAPCPSFAANHGVQREQAQVKPRKKNRHLGALDLPAEEVTAGQPAGSGPGYPHSLPGEDSLVPPAMPRLPGDPERLSAAWSLAVPSRDVWVWSDTKSIIISDPAFLLINREKISGKGNCSSYIAVFWFAWFFGFFFFFLFSACTTQKELFQPLGPNSQAQLKRNSQCEFLPE